MVSDILVALGLDEIKGVLILVLMEYGLGLFFWNLQKETPECLNPCFNGIWSRTRHGSFIKEFVGLVLILVLMEYGLGQSVENILAMEDEGS